MSEYLKVKIDGLPIPKVRLVKGPQKNQYVGTVSHVLFNLHRPESSSRRHQSGKERPSLKHFIRNALRTVGGGADSY